LARTELRTATDAAARAGAKELSLKQNESLARSKAKEAAKRNMVAGQPLILSDADVQVGKSVQVGTGRFNFTNGGTKPNAVRVYGKRTSASKSGPVDLMMAPILGQDDFEPIQTATSTQLDRDICLVVDRSGSMMWTLTSDNYPKGTKECDKPHPSQSRWGALNTSVDAFLDELVASIPEPISRRIHITGWVDRETADNYFAATDVCLAPYRGDTLLSGSGAITWGLSSGRPVIASKIEAFQSVDRIGNCLFLVTPEKTSELAWAIQKVVSDPALRERLVINANRFSEKHSWNSNVSTLSDIYGSVLQRPTLATDLSLYPKSDAA
jgi:hypothetical protein